MEILTFPTLVSTGAIFPKAGVKALALNGDEIPLATDGDFMWAEKWSNGTIFALVDGKQRRIDPVTVDYVARAA